MTAVTAASSVVRPWVALGLLCGALSLSACATHPAGEGVPAMSPPSTSKEDCIYSTLVSDWSALDSQRLIIYAPGRNDPYLVKLSFPSNDLSFRFALGVLDADHNGRICGYGFDAIVIPGGIPPRISITSVQKLTKDEAAKLVAEARPKKKPKGKPPAGAIAPETPAT